jgi:hypothetical protein
MVYLNEFYLFINFVFSKTINSPGYIASNDKIMNFKKCTRNLRWVSSRRCQYLHYIASNGGMNYELERIWKEVAAAYEAYHQL